LSICCRLEATKLFIPIRDDDIGVLASDVEENFSAKLFCLRFKGAFRFRKLMKWLTNQVPEIAF
jgi:hypothetical protein